MDLIDIALGIKPGKSPGSGDGEKNKINSIKVNGKELPIDTSKSVDITIPTKTSDLEDDSNFIDIDQMKEYAQPIGDYATKEDLKEYTLVKSTGVELVLNVNPETYVMELKLKNAIGDVISSQEFDFPFEMAFVDVDYNKETHEIKFIMQNGAETDPIQISDIIRGLVPDSRTITGIDLKEDITVEQLKQVLGINNFATTEDVKNYAQPKGNYITEIPNNYITEEELEEKHYLTDIPDNYITENDLEGKGYLTEIPSEYVTEKELDDKGYLVAKPDEKTVTVDEDGILHVVGDGSGTSGKDGKSAYQIAIDNGFVGDEEQWLESLKGNPGEPGKNGRSIQSIITDNNNVIVTFSDGQQQNIGQLNVDVEADFLTSGGFGNLRYYNGHFQYYNDGQWIDTSITPDNVYIMNMSPQPMQFIMGVYDKNINRYKLKFKEPQDTVIEGQVACVVESVLIRRKKNGVPTSETDGEFVANIPRSQFGNYEYNWFVDETFNPKSDEVWYYKAFPLSTTGFYNVSNLNETDGVKAKDYELYGFVLNQNESNPESMITYIEDNEQFRSAHMNYTTDKFDYGDWNVGDVFFMNVRPCMLRYDGTVAYYLNPNDYSLKENGEPSDIEDASFDGNAMVQFPKIYWKIVDNGDDTANIYISDKKVDENFHCWSHIDLNGNEIPYCYMPIYNGSNQCGVLRSLSGKTPINNQTAQTEINYAKANNQDDNEIWYTEVYADRMLIDLLLLLIGKSTDTQKIFGNGYYTGEGSSVSYLLITGIMNQNGLFYGKNTATKNGIKIFGIEHWWGNQWRRIAGWICDKGKQKIKLTYDKSDGSMVDGYNLDGNGYIEIPESTPSRTNQGYISSMIFHDKGIIPKTANGSSTTYYTDGLMFDNSKVNYIVVGSRAGLGYITGMLCTALNSQPSSTNLNFGASISCKPLSK